MAKGLEFPYIYIVGMEEDLFPSGMSVNTRAELEEERRLFYVALTRAKKKLTISFAESRYRWGKLNYTDPSRFISEIEDQYLDYNYRKDDLSGNPFLDADIFGADDFIVKNKKSFEKKKFQNNRKPAAKKNPNPMPKNLKKITDLGAGSGQENISIKIGQLVEHSRFGRGQVMNIEGQGSNKKATIKFEGTGEKKLLLKFAKLKILD